MIWCAKADYLKMVDAEVNYLEEKARELFDAWIHANYWYKMSQASNRNLRTWRLEVLRRFHRLRLVRAELVMEFYSVVPGLRDDEVRWAYGKDGHAAILSYAAVAGRQKETR
jgi:hypothetical protein